MYKDDTSTSSFHDMVSSMSRMTKEAAPTPFHHMLATIANEDRLLRLYSQNVDGIDTALEPLKTSVPLRKDEGGKWPKTVQLHGSLDKMVCSKCHELSDLNADLFSGPVPPACPNCEEFNSIRVNHEGKRSHGIGRLRPRMVLYNEGNPDDAAIGSVTTEDLRKRPDAVIVAGTTLKVPGVKRIVREMCKTVRNRRGGVAIWINTDLPPVAKELEDCFDIIVQGPCDEVARRAAMRKWDAPREQDECSQVTEDEMKNACARKAEVHLPRCQLTAAHVEALPTQLHLNNSFKPPPVDKTPRKPLAPPEDWSPLVSRNSPVVGSIETDSENITVSNTGLLTPSKPPAKISSLLSDKLMQVSKTKNPVGRPRNAATNDQKAKKANVKVVKASKPKAGATSKVQAGPRQNALTNTFKQTKAASTVAAGGKKGMASPARTPSKLRQTSNAASHAPHPMHPLSPEDARQNTSPFTAEPPASSLLSENAVQGTKRMNVSDMLN